MFILVLVSMVLIVILATGVIINMVKLVSTNKTLHKFTTSTTLVSKESGFRKTYYSKTPKLFRPGLVVTNNVFDSNLLHPGYAHAHTVHHTISDLQADQIVCLAFHSKIALMMRTHNNTCVLAIFDPNGNTNITEFEFGNVELLTATKLKDNSIGILVACESGVHFLRTGEDGKIIEQDKPIRKLDRVINLQILETNDSLLFFISNDESETFVFIKKENVVPQSSQSFEWIIDTVDFFDGNLFWVSQEDDKVFVSRNFETPVCIAKENISTPAFTNDHRLLLSSGTYKYDDKIWIQESDIQLSHRIGDHTQVSLNDTSIDLYLLQKKVQSIPLIPKNCKRQLLSINNSSAMLLEWKNNNAHEKIFNLAVTSIYNLGNRLSFDSLGKHTHPIGIVESVQKYNVTIVLLGGKIELKNLEYNKHYYADPDGVLTANSPNSSAKIGYAISETTLVTKMPSY